MTTGTSVIHFIVTLVLLAGAHSASAAIPPSKPLTPPKPTSPANPALRAVPVAPHTATMPTLNQQIVAKAGKASPSQVTLIFDIPVTYNARVSHWLEFFQTRGKTWFREWLEKSTKYMPFIQKELREAGLPTDLGYMVMIESGFNHNARSVANAMGPWQFIEPTGKRYGLNVSWWIDERRDLRKATRAATRYIRDLYAEFGSWYLVAASYNMGENGLRNRIRKHGTKDFWALSKKKAIPQETIDYVPKILAAMLIAKAPGLYGFRDLAQMDPLDYDVITATGGTDLGHLAEHLGITRKALLDLNAEMILGYVPVQVDRHLIRVPKGAERTASEFLKKRYPAVPTQTQNAANETEAKRL